MNTRMKKTYIILTAVLMSVCRGIKEGMVMHSEGVRNHRWFKDYHPLSALVPLTSGLFFIALSTYLKALDIWTSSAMCILTWESFELAYSHARYKKFFPKSENIFGFGINARGYQVVLLHVVRISIGITLLTRGLL